MKSLSTLLLVGLLTLVGVVEARGATAQDAFLAKLKAVGVTTDPLTSKKPCLCVGTQLIGVLIAIPNIRGPSTGMIAQSLPLIPTDRRGPLRAASAAVELPSRSRNSRDQELADRPRPDRR